MKTKKSILALVLLMVATGVSAQVVDTIPFDGLHHNKWITGQPVPKQIIQSTRSFRERLLADPYRPAYHFCVPEGDGKPGDPNGAFYANGRYHLMYLYRREGRGFSWGHVSSKDMLHWRHHPDALVPSGNEDGIYSGGAFVDNDGKAILSYWQVIRLAKGETFNERISRKGPSGISLAHSTDEHYNEWVKPPYNPVIKSTDWGITETSDVVGNQLIYGSADPSNIWEKDGKYYMLTGNLLVLNKYGRQENAAEEFKGDHAHLFVSEDLQHWEYLHEFYDRNDRWTDTSEDNMCASFLPLPSAPNGGMASGKHLLLFISHNKGAQYYIGTYGNDRFKPETHGRMSWVDNAYFAPEALVDDSGRQIMWSWIFDDRPDSLKAASGWTGTYGLPRSLWLGEDGNLHMAPIEELRYLRHPEKSMENLTVHNGREITLDGFGHELLELEITVELNGTKTFGVKVGCAEDGREETTIYYDAVEKSLNMDTRKSSLGFGRKAIESAPFELKEDRLVLRVFVDKSIVEVFANDRQAIARSVYPTLGGTAVKLFAEAGNATVLSVKAWEIMPSNPY